MGTASAGSASATRGGTFGCAARVSSASVVRPSTSMLSKTTVVISLAMAVWTAGSSASGATVSTYASVSESCVLAQTDATESGASTQASVMRMADDTAHQTDCRGGSRRAGV